MKKIFVLILAVMMCFALASCGNDRSASIEGIKAQLDPIMAEYGVEEYDILITVSERYEIVCPELPDMKCSDVIDILKAAISLGEMENMEEEGEIIRFSGNIRETDEEDSEYYYYVNEAQAELSDRSSAGLYCSENHGTCIYRDND